VQKVVEKSWLKQLRVAISTGASLPKKDQVHKIRKQILSTCATLIQKFSKVREKILFLKVYSVEIREQQVFQAFLQVFMQNGKVVEGDVFSRKKHTHCLIRIKTSE
jgi:hypothetical protein